MGRKQELDLELGEYIKGKKKKKIDVMSVIKGIMPKPSPPPVKLPPEIQPYGDEEEKKTEKKEEKKPELKAEEPKLGFEEQQTDVEEYEAEAKKPFFNSILEKIGIKPGKTAAKTQEEELLREQGEEEKIKGMVEKEFLLKDIKSLAKMTLFVIKQLPKERMDQFKQSSDFADLKELLKKYKLIK